MPSRALLFFLLSRCQRSLSTMNCLPMLSIFSAGASFRILMVDTVVDLDNCLILQPHMLLLIPLSHWEVADPYRLLIARSLCFLLSKMQKWETIKGLENAKRLLKEAVVMPIKYPKLTNAVVIYACSFMRRSY